MQLTCMAPGGVGVDVAAVDGDNAASRGGGHSSPQLHTLLQPLNPFHLLSIHTPNKLEILHCMARLMPAKDLTGLLWKPCTSTCQALAPEACQGLWITVLEGAEWAITLLAPWVVPTPVSPHCDRCPTHRV